MLFAALLVFAHAALAADTRYTFVNFTGVTGGAGAEDGDGAAARFYSPIGISTDSNGNVYVADLNNATIRKIAPNGTTTTLAGLAGAFGKALGTGAAAQFGGPTGTAVDSKGNIFVCDSLNHQIRKVTPQGVVTIFAGGNSSGALDANGTKAFFNFPADIAIDAADNIWVADANNHTIRKITPSGDVTTVAGSAPVKGYKDGSGKVAQFSFPNGVACDKDGNVYVADTANCAIRKVTPAGVVTTFAGHPGPGHDDGIGTAASFHFPYGLCFGPSGNLYVADTQNNLIRKITPGAAVSTIAGNPEQVKVGDITSNLGTSDGTGSAARFYYPYDIAADNNGTLYVVDTNNHTIRKITADSVVTTFAGKALPRNLRDGPPAEAQFIRIQDMAADALGNIVLIDDRMIRKISPNGTVSTVAGGPWDALNPYVDGPASAARFDAPRGLAVDRDGNIYIARRTRSRSGRSRRAARCRPSPASAIRSATSTAPPRRRSSAIRATSPSTATARSTSPRTAPSAGSAPTATSAPSSASPARSPAATTASTAPPHRRASTHRTTSSSTGREIST